ncbi:MAG: DUF2892 domain-containing protein [Deltaproteobacteria bacterium]|nr:DUF2892 domain-containing protein [Deltaproteobacteria bacterium]
MRISKNVGPTERKLRFAGSVAAGAAALLVPELGRSRIPLGIVSAELMFTAITRFCPMNALLGIDRYTPGVERRIEKDRRRRELLPSPGLNPY